MKRIPAVLLALAVIFLLGGAALAEGGTYSASHGVVTQVDTEAQTMTIRLGGREEGTLTLDISEETKDSHTFLPGGFSLRTHRRIPLLQGL